MGVTESAGGGTGKGDYAEGSEGGTEKSELEGLGCGRGRRSQYLQNIIRESKKKRLKIIKGKSE